MTIERLHATFYVLAIALFVLSVTICEIITFQLPNVLGSNFDLERSRTLTILIKNWQEKAPCQRAYVCKNGASRFIRLFAVHIHTFSEGHTYSVLSEFGRNSASGNVQISSIYIECNHPKEYTHFQIPGLIESNYATIYC